LSKGIIFDFDGTLVDSEKAIYETFESITRLIAPERESFAKNILIGPPLRDTATEILGIDYQDQLDKFVNLFIEMHDEKVTKHTQPYPDVANILQRLHKNNVHMAIATNKRKVPVIKLINYFGWNDYFTNIECSDNKSLSRNKTELIKDIIEDDIRFKHGFFLGDTVNDGISANLNKLKFIQARYGYGSNQNWSKVNVYNSISNFYEIENIF